MKKPKTKTLKYLDYFDMREYIKEKHNINFDDEEHSFWDWLCFVGDIHNGGFVYLFPIEEGEEEEYDDWVRNIINLIFAEFPKSVNKNGSIRLETSW